MNAGLKITENPMLVLEGLLDTFDYPAIIADKSGAVCVNEYIRRADDKETLIQTAIKACNTRNYNITFQGKKLIVSKRAINHGTDYFLIEIKQDDEIVNKLRESTKKLRLAVQQLQIN